MSTHSKVATFLTAAGIGLTTVLAGTASAAPAATVVLTVNVTSLQASPGDITVTDVTNTTTYGTCNGAATPGTATCSISVPATHGLLVQAQASPGEQLSVWHSACAGAPGPVCHVYVKTSAETVTGAFGFKPPGPSVTTVQPYTQGNPPNCNANLTVTANGTGFPSNQPATLSDNGNLVASGKTDINGFVSLSYVSAASEPGIYRVLVLGAGATATTDIYNSSLICFGAQASGGTVSFSVYYSGFDANSSSVVLRFRNNAPVPLAADATGAGTATSPAYACPKGQTFNEVIAGTRGAGNHFKYHFSVSVPFTCP